MDVTARFEPKIKKLLSKLLDSSFEIPNDLYLNTLLSHLSGKYDPDLSREIQDLSILTEWIIQAVSFWENGHQPSQSASIFALNLVSLLSKDEKRFAYFKTFNIYNSLSLVLKVKSKESTPSVKLGYIKMLSALLEHKLGLDWLISTDNWREVLNFSLEAPTVYILREGHEFMFRLLKKSIDFNEIFCKLIVKQIVMKLNEFLNFGFNVSIDEEVLKKRSEPILKLISYILESFLKEKDNNYDYRVPNLFILTFSLENILWNYSNLSQTVDFTNEIDKTILLTMFLKVASIKSELIPSNDLRSCGASILKLLSSKVTKKQHLNILKVCFYAGQFWNYLTHRIKKPTSETALLRMENHLVPIELLPIISVTFKHCNIMPEDFEIDDIRDEFISKLFKAMGEGMTRVAFQWKEQLLQYPDVFPLAIAALRNIMNGRKTYRRSRAIIVFQGCVYSFKDVTWFIKTNKVRNPEIFIRNPAYLISLISCLSTLINENDITWAESLETICVLSVTIDFINLQIWSSRVVVEALKLLNLSIAKYMSPNLALLLDNAHDSALDQLGPLLLRNLQDITWEVRDSALEVLKTMVMFSITKFPSFRGVIKSSDLLSLTLTMALNDSESFVRASSIKCLQEMIKVSEFWNVDLLKMDLPKKMMVMLRNESEAIVRTEISKLMRCIYEHQAFPVDLMDMVYDSMFIAATKDFHWEVKTNALDFWGKVVLNHLQDQGMIDGSFPDVTFSREHKKIITLTENEIKTRLHKVLFQLANCGCLSVLISSLQDECDIEVVKKSVEKLKKMSVLFKMYKLIPENDYSPQHSLSPSSSTISPPITPQINYSDEIIDQIVNSKDINLLKDVYNPSDVVTMNDNLEIQQKNKLVSPEEFLRTINTDLDAIVKSKSKWIQNLDDLDSLLDDILKEYNNVDVNNMDCY